MNIAIIKKSVFAALAVVVVATGSVSATTNQAEAGYRSWGGGHGHYSGHRHGYRRHGYGHGYRRSCWTERRWRTNYDGYSYRVKVRVCR
ncbi:MAG: hypothetical protein JKX93_15500 [Rhizobiaceae bacterium]|nr:hypothetical protein [Rhizobiaceae bacterium]